MNERVSREVERRTRALATVRVVMLEVFDGIASELPVGLCESVDVVSRSVTASQTGDICSTSDENTCRTRSSSAAVGVMVSGIGPNTSSLPFEGMRRRQGLGRSSICRDLSKGLAVLLLRTVTVSGSSTR